MERREKFQVQYIRIDKKILKNMNMKVGILLLGVKRSLSKPVEKRQENVNVFAATE